MTRGPGGRPRSSYFVVLTDPLGAMYVSCDRKNCSWIRPVVRNSTIYAIERLTQRHTHTEAST